MDFKTKSWTLFLVSFLELESHSLEAHFYCFGQAGNIILERAWKFFLPQIFMLQNKQVVFSQHHCLFRFCLFFPSKKSWLSFFRALHFIFLFFRIEKMSFVDPQSVAPSFRFIKKACESPATTSWVPGSDPKVSNIVRGNWFNLL